MTDAFLEKAAREDNPVIGYVGTDTPVELIDAAGALAYRLGSTPDDLLDEAVSLLGSAVDHPALSILSQILSGKLDFMRGLLISRDCQASLRLFYVLRQLRADGRDVPDAHLVDLLHLPRESTARYNLSQVRKTAAVVTEWTGAATSYADVRHAIEGRAEVRDALLQLQARRRAASPTVTGTDVLRAHAVAHRSFPGHAIEAATSVPTTHVQEGVRLFVTGSGQDDDAAYSRLEAAGAHVVGEDHSWGELALDMPVRVSDATDLTGLYDALARARQGSVDAATSGLRDRAEYTRRAIAESGADAVVSLVRSNDVAPDWDYPMIDCVRAARVRGVDGSFDADELVGALS